MINKIVKDYFGFDSLRQDQIPIIKAMREGHDVFATLTTGGGKSLTYQATAIENHLRGRGATVVVSPLISLMADQVSALQSRGVSAEKVNSSTTSMSRYHALNSLVSGSLQMLYVSPEKLADEEVISCLKASTIASFVIDEAHCVSIWGQSFRPSYLKINTIVQEIENHQNRRIQRCALTATSKSDVTEDVMSNLGLLNPIIIKGNPDRENIKFYVIKSQDKLADLLNLLEDIGGETTIIYCATVKLTKEIARRLNDKGLVAKPYYGALPNHDKEQTQHEFASGKINLLCATNAFGMGIDISHIRNVIHFNMPSSIENYYQEAGRAGRDGKDAAAYLLYSPSDRGIHDYFIHWQFPPREVILQISSVVKSLTAQGAASYSPAMLAAACKNDVDARHVSATLRILKENGIVDYNDYLDSPEYPVDYLRDAEIDFAILQKRERINCEKLTLMERYAKTQSCKRKFLLSYFDGQHEGRSSNCGKCSSCHEKELNNDRLSNHVTKGDIATILTALTDAKGRKDTCIKILQGSDSPRMKRRGFDRTESYGAMKGISKQHIEGMIGKIEAAGLITENERISINESAAKEHLKTKRIDSIVLELRKQVASKHKIPEFMVMSDKQCLEVTSSLKTKTLKEALSLASVNPKIIQAALEILDQQQEASSALSSN